MKTSKNKGLVTAILLTFVGVLFLGIVTVLVFLFFNEKTIVVPDDADTIQEAVNGANPGDIIVVKASGGPYEGVTINTEDIKLIGIGKKKPVLDGNNVDPNGITIMNTSGVRVKNFIIQNFTITGISVSNSDGNMVKGNICNGSIDGIFVGDSNSNMIIGNTCSDNSIGIELDNSDTNLVQGNTVNGNSNGIVLQDDSGNNTIKGNTANDNDLDGITLSANSNDNDVLFNRAFGNMGDDISNFGVNNFKGNKCDNSNQFGICN
ncbi:right-handed parallel beta-helix repeat-containing protein [Jeotgalibacillus marinus]|uniref:Right-handed parallel beta-helix repeat-containing protein n=1 Tax=Jeotgalibacillus marinus TaxID=86667 RepID=A0ABV3Q6I5_9BACL